MNNRDEDLTLENVDERAEQLKRASQEQANALTPLARAARDLQRVYDEERRLEHAWERISSRARSLENITQPAIHEKSNNQLSFQGEQKTMREIPSDRPGSFQNTPDGPFQAQRPPRRQNWRNFGLGLAATIILIAIFAWTITAVYHNRSTQTISGGGCPPIGSTPTRIMPTTMPPASPTPTPQDATTTSPIVTPTVGGSVPATSTPTPAPTQVSPGTTSPCPVVTPTPTAGEPTTPTPTTIAGEPATPTPTPAPIQTPFIWQAYTCQSFTVKYPAQWTMTSSGSGDAYLQSVQFRPSAHSPVLAQVGALYNNDLSAAQLLQQDSVVKQGTLESTSTVTNHGLTWTVDIVNVPGSVQAQAGKFEIAYSNQTHAYRAEFAAPPDQYPSYSKIFQTMLASFMPAQ